MDDPGADRIHSGILCGVPTFQIELRKVCPRPPAHESGTDPGLADPKSGCSTGSRHAAQRLAHNRSSINMVERVTVPPLPGQKSLGKPLSNLSDLSCPFMKCSWYCPPVFTSKQRAEGQRFANCKGLGRGRGCCPYLLGLGSLQGWAALSSGSQGSLGLLEDRGMDFLFQDGGSGGALWELVRREWLTLLPPSTPWKVPRGISLSL